MLANRLIVVALPLVACAHALSDDEPIAAPFTDNEPTLPDAGLVDRDAPLESGAHDTSDAGPRVRVLTMNLWNPALNGEHADERMAVISAFIKEAQPDFVSLQEATKTGSKNVAEEIAQATGYAVLWKRGMNAGLWEEGPAALSKSPITTSETIALPHEDLAGIMTRRAIRVVAKTALGEVAFYATHTFVTPDDGKKLDQMAALSAFVAKYPSELPSFVAGDLNATPMSPPMQFLRGEITHEGKKGTFVDAWLVVNPNDPGFTSPAAAPKERIDYVYVAPAKQAWKVAACKRVLDAPVNGIAPSDHAGVMCDFVP